MKRKINNYCRNTTLQYENNLEIDIQPTNTVQTPTIYITWQFRKAHGYDTERFKPSVLFFHSQVIRKRDQLQLIGRNFRTLEIH